MQLPVGVVGPEPRLERMHDDQLLQPEVPDQLIAIVQRLLEMLAGIEEDDRYGSVDLRDHVQQHRRIGAKRRHGCDFPAPELVHGGFDDLLRRKPAIGGLERGRLLDGRPTAEGLTLHGRRHHRAPP